MIYLYFNINLNLYCHIVIILKYSVSQINLQSHKKETHFFLFFLIVAKVFIFSCIFKHS